MSPFIFYYLPNLVTASFTNLPLTTPYNFPMYNRSLAILVLLLISHIPTLAAPNAKGSYQVFVGTYTGTESKGIYTFRFDPATGKASTPVLAAESENPSFLAVDPQHRFLYAANEVHNYQGTTSGAVTVFAIDPKTWKLNFQQQVPSVGGDPCHLTLDRTGHYLLIANYTGGNVAVFRIDANGRLGERTALDQHTGSSVNHDRQQAPHAHAAQMTPDNRFALSPDLGNDHVVISRFDPARGTLTHSDPAVAEAGSGPRHAAFAPSGNFLYVLNELTPSVTVFSLDPRTGATRALQTIDAVSKHDPANTSAEIVMDHAGHFLYTSTRHDDSIAIFKVAQNSGKLTLVDRLPAAVKTPRFITLDPTGRWMFVAGQDSNDIALFRVDKSTGKLTPTDMRIAVGAPVCLVFVRRT
jgi:6-phosphogluconolactonase